ncbi:MAG TPA: TonB-dependent receptor [Sulfurimonas sp.]|uniref:TonB-dependent receptor plug domain-containing protein n=1 Tax=Sulfurimonas sp. TaxID=2022749 RepID=UPI002C0B638D|nr:TonB-dependent receptor [Sulfurimonas sp.]HUH42644.1 TonB-dependent receptor [Sulfurimonas sp.]
MRKQTISITASMLLFTGLYGAQNNPQKLENIVITTKSASEAIDTAGSYTIISKEDIKEMNVNTIADILEVQTGITTGVNASSQQGRSAINLRGMDSKHSLILIDGRRISASDALIGMSDFAYSWVPINAIEKIEIVKGPMSSLYGSSAIGGVINIITKKPTENFFGEIDAKYGFSSADGGNEQDYSFNVGGKITNSLSATFSGQMINIELIKNGNDALAKREGRDVKNGILNLWYDIDNTSQISISSMRGNEIRDNLKFDEYYDINRAHDSIEYEKYFDDIKMNLKYYMTSLDAHSDDTSLLYTHKMDDKVANAEFAISKFSNNYIVLGAEMRSEEYKKIYDTSTVNNFKDKIDYTSFYLQDEISIADDFILTLGGRYDKHENFGAELSPKAYLVYKFDEYNRIKGGYGHGFNAPALTQSSDNYVFINPVLPPLTLKFIGNSELKPESSDSFEVGYEHNKDSNIFKTTFFYTKIKDLITYELISTTPKLPFGVTQTRQYENVDKATIFGFEAEYERKNLLSNLDLSLGYNFLDTQDDTTKKDLIFRPKHKANLKLSSKLPFDINTVLRVNYIGEQYTGVEDVDGFFTTGISFSKEVMRGFSVIAGVDNLFDKQLGEEYDFAIKNRVIYTRLNYKF